MDKITFKLQDNGVLYELSGEIQALVRRKSENAVAVEFWHSEKGILAPESGDLDRGSFRSRLCNLTAENFGSVNGIARAIDYIASNFNQHNAARSKAAEESLRTKNAEELRGTLYDIEGG